MDIAEIDDEGKGRLFCGRAEVVSCEPLAGQRDVYLLTVKTVLERSGQVLPTPGQFYMLKSERSSVQLLRPISLYRFSVSSLKSQKREVLLSFLILRKGEGTKELCSLIKGDGVQTLGPLGNGFSSPDSSKQGLVCIVGGGIGVAPVANLALSLKKESYDFFASFRSGSYGLEGIQAAKLTVTTDDGSVGIRGMLPVALNARVIRDRGYTAIYACGPLPMLSYIKQIAAECGVPCYLSMEKRMACGLGACLGCTLRTAEGVKRVCKDGPVFRGEILDFEPPAQRRNPLSENVPPNLSVEIAGVHFKNPVIAASGTFGFGQNYRAVFDVSRLGGISSKGCTLEKRDGNPGERLAEVASGDINSIGLQNPGIPAFISEELPRMMELGPVTLANVAGSTIDSYVAAVELLDKTNVPMIELNISCPNVKEGGQIWGMSRASATAVVGAVRAATKKPLMVKLSPNAPDIVDVALACIEAGADALSLINTIQAVAIDIEKARPVFANIKAGLCGPTVKPIALRMVYDVALAVRALPKEKQVPIVGIGGIATWQDAVEFIMAGASAVQVGTATFSDPLAMIKIIDGLELFMKSHGYASISEMCGLAL